MSASLNVHVYVSECVSVCARVLFYYVSICLFEYICVKIYVQAYLCICVCACVFVSI